MYTGPDNYFHFGGESHSVTTRPSVKCNGHRITIYTYLESL